MKDLASWALDTASARGASYCDLRLVDDRQRALATKNGAVSHASDSESFGVGIRVIAAYSFKCNEIQKRSYPNSVGGQYQNRGYELIEELKLVENARRIGEEAVALHGAAQCPQGSSTIILDSSQLGLQIHESVGHP